MTKKVGDTTKKVGAKKDTRFKKGVSGNPAGRPKGSRNMITLFRENTELALREYMASPANQKKALAAIDRCFRIAMEADDKEAMQAMKILFDKVLPNARHVEEADGGKQRPVAIQIINQTSEHASSPVTVIDGQVIDGEIIEG